MRIHLVQEAYHFLTKNYARVADQCAYISESSLTNQSPVALRSHWIYKSIEQLDNKKK
jgi:hypothetical protein